MGLLDNQTLNKVRKLCKDSCANYVNDECILTDRKCDYFTKHGESISCDYFEKSVLPNDKQLQEA